jgi:hypothetical protein
MSGHACILTSRGITNEVYYAAQKAARLSAQSSTTTPARLAAASTVAMKPRWATAVDRSYVDCSMPT